MTTRTFSFPNHARIPTRPAHFDTLPRSEPPPEGPNTETEADFQRRIDELLAYRTPVRRDVAFMTAVMGMFCMIAAAFLWAMG